MSVVVLSLALGACGGEQALTPTAGDQTAAVDPAKDLGPVLAEVGSVKVYESEFKAAAARKTPANGESLSLDERKEVLQKLIEEKALYQEAKKEGIDQDPKVQKVMVNTLLRQKVYASVKTSDLKEEELRAYFDTHKDEFVMPERAQIKRIFVHVSEKRTSDEAKKLADGLRTQLVADPTQFAKIAEENSEDPYRRRGGDLGFISKEGKPGIDQAVVDKAFTLEKGQISEPFEAGGGYNIVMVAEKREGQERTFEQMRSSVIRRMKNDKYKEEYDRYVAERLGAYKVTIDEQALGAVSVEAARRLGPGPGPLGMLGGHGGPEGMDDQQGGGMAGAEAEAPLDEH